MFKKLAFFLFACILAFTLNSQEIWSLEKCVNYARENNLNIKLSDVGIEYEKLNIQQNKYGRIPSVNGTINGGMQFGRTIDPTTNDFDNQEIGFNSYSLNAGALLYNGNRVNNTIKQSQIDLEAALEDANATVNTLSLGVAATYLQILLSEEQLGNAQNRLRQTEEQLDQTEKLIRAGSIPANDSLDIIAQIALNEQTIVDAQNAVDANYLNLKQLLELDPNFNLRIERPEIVIPPDSNPDRYTVREVYANALGIQPEVRAGELKIKSAEIGTDIAKSLRLPSLSVFGSLSSNYSSIAKNFSQDGFNTESVDQTVYIEDQPVNIRFENQIPIFVTSNKPYFDQIKENFGQSVGVSLSIPIYNNHRTQIALERAQLGILNAQVTHQQTLQNLKTDVQRSVADAKAAKRSYEAAQKSVRANEAAFGNAEKKFNLGSINTFEYTTAKNNLDHAQVELTRSRYQYLFSLKVVDFYQGKKMTIN
ncbi:MAG: TolC family protein [Bacteroidetes bacterium]|nr:TolC family protein [Bacteroidota bacterium]